MLQEEQAIVQLFRFDPEIDTKARYDNFKAPYRGRSVLDVLQYIHQNLDSTFAFRWACEKHFCRCCVVSVNKKPVLACMAPAEKNMKIEPHPKFKVMKDLVVDLNQPKETEV